jgi:hypothetical protein
MALTCRVEEPSTASIADSQRLVQRFKSQHTPVAWKVSRNVSTCLAIEMIALARSKRWKAAIQGARATSSMAKRYVAGDSPEAATNRATDLSAHNEIRSRRRSSAYWKPNDTEGGHRVDGSLNMPQKHLPIEQDECRYSTAAATCDVRLAPTRQTGNRHAERLEDQESIEP